MDDFIKVPWFISQTYLYLQIEKITFEAILWP